MLFDGVDNRNRQTATAAEIHEWQLPVQRDVGRILPAGAWRSHAGLDSRSGCLFDPEIASHEMRICPPVRIRQILVRRKYIVCGKN